MSTRARDLASAAPLSARTMSHGGLPSTASNPAPGRRPPSRIRRRPPGTRAPSERAGGCGRWRQPPPDTGSQSAAAGRSDRSAPNGRRSERGRRRRRRHRRRTTGRTGGAQSASTATTPPLRPGQLRQRALLLADALPIRFSLENTPNDTVQQVRAKERALAELARPDAALTRWKRIAHVWCAAWFADPDAAPPSSAFGPLSDQALTGRSALPTAHGEPLSRTGRRGRPRAPALSIGSSSSRRCSSIEKARACRAPASTR